VKVAREAGAKTLVLFHHDPDSTDRMVDGLLRQAREELIPCLRQAKAW